LISTRIEQLTGKLFFITVASSWKQLATNIMLDQVQVIERCTCLRSTHRC